MPLWELTFPPWGEAGSRHSWEGTSYGPTTVGRHPGALGSDSEGTRLHPGMAFFPHHVSSVLVTSWQ